jgi:branched-chain amino acid transport system permease protein
MRRSVAALVLIGALATVLLSSAPGAGAQEPGSTTSPPTSASSGSATTATTAAGGTTPTTAAGGSELPDDAQIVSGNLRYEQDDEPKTAEGATVTAESADGSYTESVETDADGRFEIPVPAPGTYTITLDEESLPEEVGLTNDRASLDVRVREGRANTPVLFPLGYGDQANRNVSSDFDRFLRLTVQGLRFGLIIAMCAIGLSLIFGTTRLTNFAHGEMVTFGALIAYLFNVTWGWHMLIAAPAAIVLATFAGSGFDKFFWRPLRNRGTGLIAMLVISIGVSIAVRYFFNLQFGGFNRAYRQYALQTTGYEIGPITLVPRDLFGMVLSVVVLVAVALFLQRTRTGKAMRAVSDNRDLAESSGVDVDRVINFVWAAGAGLAALGGILQGLSEQVSWQMGFQLLLLMFAGVTLGGLGTAYGALVGSMVVGMVVEVSTLFIPSEFKTVTALFILILILLVRPQGILGQAERVG